MRKFKDAAGLEWTLSVNVQTATLLKTEADINVRDIADPDGKILIKIISDPVAIGAALWTLVAKEAESRGVNQESFFSNLGGDAVEDAATAFVAECFDFFPHSKRSLLHKAWERTKSVDSRLDAEAATKLDQMTDEQLLAMAQEMNKTTGNLPSGTSPASSELTPPASPSSN